MRLGNRIARATALAVLLGGLAAASPAGAAGGPPITGTGTVSCKIAGRILFSPPLSNTGTATSETITVKANLNGCSGTGDGATVVHGKATGTATTASNNCSSLTGTTPTNLTTTTRWKTGSHGPALADTTVAYTTTTGSVNLSGSAELTSTGTATAGSFSGDNATATAVISRSLASIGMMCNKGKLKGVTFNASASVASLG